jgi:twitching motility protein PilT
MVAAPGYAPISVKFEGAAGHGDFPTQGLLSAMLRASDQISDLVFSPGRAPQVEVHGQLIPVQGPGLRSLSADDTRRIAADLISNNKQALTMLREQGSCDVSYGLPGLARFRVNVFIQRGSCAVVMRVIPTSIPDRKMLGLPPQVDAIAHLQEGIVLVSGPRGSGKSSSLAALLDSINQEQTCHIITIEDPIEFLHNHRKATIHQRELHSDTPSYAHALRAALRQSPRVILVGDMRDRETMEMILEAAETGHLVLSSVNTVDASKAVERFVSAFPSTDHGPVRSRLAKTLRYIIAQRLIPRMDNGSRVAAFEILKNTPRVRECIEHDSRPDQNLLPMIKEGAEDGMQHFDQQIAELVKQGAVDIDTALGYATDPQELRNLLQAAR